MDRIDAMTAFAAAVDEGSLAAAARRLGRSAASVTRAVALLEDRVGARLLHRTTRVVRLTEAGERFLVTCRRVLSDIEEGEAQAAGALAVPRGLLTVTAPALFGRLHVRPVVDALLAAHPDVQVQFQLLDRVVDLIDEGIDIAVRIGHLPDSSLIAVKVGEVRRVVCAGPDYLAGRTAPSAPAELAGHECIAFSQISPNEVWTFAPGPDGGAPKHVRVKPRLTVNGAEAAVASTAEGRGITRVLSYQIERALKAGQVVRILEAFEPPPLPVHIVYPEGRLAVAKARAFVDLAVPRLKASLTRIDATLRAAARP